MSLGIECLLSQDLAIARKLASQLDELNIERRKIENEMKDQANLVLNKLVLDSNSHLPLGLCLVDPVWHQGVIGILAGRLKEKYHRPTIIFAVIDDKELKGSARSVSGLNIRDILALIDKDNPGLITKFGGHAMAAGLTLPIKSFDRFRSEFIKEVENNLDLASCAGDIYSDGSLSEIDLDLDLANIIAESGPWGSFFPEPQFDNIFEILDQKIVGKNHLKLTLTLFGGDKVVEAIAFNIDLNIWPNNRISYIHALYKLGINQYQGRKKLQIVIDNLLILPDNFKNNPGKSS